MPPFWRIRHRPPPPPRSRVSRRLTRWTKCSFKTIANNIQDLSLVTLYSIIINIISTEMTTTTNHDKGSTKCVEGKNIHNLKSAGKICLKRRALCKEGYHWSRGISRDYRERLWFNREADWKTSRKEPNMASLFSVSFLGTNYAAPPGGFWCT